jgi:hypothetical protein
MMAMLASMEDQAAAGPLRSDIVSLGERELGYGMQCYRRSPRCRC